MKKILISIALLAVVFAAACNQADTEAPKAQAGKAPAAKPAATAEVIPAGKDTPIKAGGCGEGCLKGTTIALDSGEEAQVFCVSDFDKDLKDLEGLIAVEGRVSTVYADRGAFMLVDCDRTAACTDGCCPETEVPVRVALDDFEVTMPETDSEVLVIGDLTVKESGYSFAVREVRQGDTVLISPKSESV